MSTAAPVQCCMNDCKFTAEEKQPKLLPCLHRACEACLEKYYKEGLQEGEGGDEDPPCGSTYACHEPRCTRLIGRKPEQLPYDELLIRELQESAQASCEGCEESSAFATHHCGKCEVLLCGSCVEAHKTSPLRFMRSHPLATIAEYRAQRAAGDSANPPRCVLHTEEPIKMFCNTCNVAICLLCGTMLHPQGELHEVVTLEAGHGPQKQKLTALAATMDEASEKATAAAGSVSSVKEELESNIQTARDAVEADFKLISQAAVRCRKGMLAKIDATGGGKVEALDAQTTALEDRATAATLASAFSRKLVADGNQNETLQMANVVVSGMTGIVDSVPQHEPVRVAKFEFQGSSGGADAIVKVIEAYGKVLAYGGHVKERDSRMLGFPLAEQLTCSRTLSPAQRWVCGIASFVDNKGERFVATAHGGGSIIIWSVANGQQIRTLSGHSNYVHGLVLVRGETAEDAVLASAGYDRTVRIWNPFTGQAIRTLSGHTNVVYGLAVHQDDAHGTVLASASLDHTVRLWRLPDGKHIQTLSGHSSTVFSVAFFQEGDSTIVASGSDDNTIRLWGYPGGETIRTLTGHAGAVYGVTTMVVPDIADETVLVSASADQAIKFWHPSTGECFRTLTGHTNQVYCVYPFHRGEGTAPCLISGSGDNTVRVWDVVEGKEIQSLTGHTHYAYCVHVIPSFDDGQKSIVASGGVDTTVRFWE